MGMPVRIVLYADGDTSARRAAAAAFARIAALEDIFSDYRVDSDVSRVSASAGGASVVVAAELSAVMRTALDVARATNGAFDPTVGPLVALWREARRTRQLPDGDRIAAARAVVGWQWIDHDPNAGTLRLQKRGMRLDLGGVAKGFILQDALRVLAGAGSARALVEAGGDIVAGAAPPNAAGWRIDTPGADADFAARASRLAHAALATSGPMPQFVEIHGRRYSHVVDPATGLGVTHDVVARVMAPDAAVADALATALAVSGPRGAATVARRFPEARISLVAGGSPFRTSVSLASTFSSTMACEWASCVSAASPRQAPPIAPAVPPRADPAASRLPGASR